MNAVFVQQTMLLANNDEDLAFKQKQKDWAAWCDIGSLGLRQKCLSDGCEAKIEATGTSFVRFMCPLLDADCE